MQRKDRENVHYCECRVMHLKSSGYWKKLLKFPFMYNYFLFWLHEILSDFVLIVKTGCYVFERLIVVNSFPIDAFNLRWNFDFIHIQSLSLYVPECVFGHCSVSKLALVFCTHNCWYIYVTSLAHKISFALLPLTFYYLLFRFFLASSNLW